MKTDPHPQNYLDLPEQERRKIFAKAGEEAKKEQEKVMKAYEKKTKKYVAYRFGPFQVHTRTATGEWEFRGSMSPGVVAETKEKLLLEVSRWLDLTITSWEESEQEGLT